MSTQLQTQAKVASQPSFLQVQTGSLQRQCACGQHTSGGGECEECRKKRGGTLQRAAVNSTSANDIPLIGPDVLSSLSQPSDTSMSSPRASSFEHDFSQVRTHSRVLDTTPHLLPRPQHLDLAKITEPVGDAACDVDQGKVVFQLDYNKIPVCMLDCAYAHEQAHVTFMQPACTRVSAAFKSFREADEKAKKSQTEANLKAVEQAADKVQEETGIYTKWVASSCKANELKAYQAGIDVCKTDKVKKECADLRETEKYTSNMKSWEDSKNKPPNCAEPAKETEKEKTSEPKRGETEKKPKEPEKKPSTK